MKKLMLIAVMALFSSGVFAAKNTKSGYIKGTIKQSKTKPPAGTYYIYTTCGKRVTVQAVSTTNQEFAMMATLANDLACGTRFVASNSCD